MKTNNTKSFAFQLASKKDNAAGNDKKWQARDGIAVAGCTAVPGYEFREAINYSGHFLGRDKGYFC